MSQEQDFYRLLGVSPDAPDREIKRAYYEAARRLHPDKAGNDEERKTNEDKLAQISRAYNTLKDATKRAEYDSHRKAIHVPGGGGGSTPAAASRPTTRPQGTANPAAPAPSANAQPGPGGGTAKEPSSRMSANDLQAQRVGIAQRSFVRGMQHFKLNEFDKAVPFFATACTNDPESEPHYFDKLAIALIRSKGSFAKAAEAAEKAVAMDSYKMEFRLTLAEVWEAAGSPTNARKVYEDILKWDPDNSKAKTRMAMLGAKPNAPGSGGMLAKLLPSVFGKKK